MEHQPRSAEAKCLNTVSCEVMASILPLLLLVLCSLNVAHCGLRVYNLYARGLRPDQNSSADGYVEMSCGSSNVKTRVNENNPNPSWTEELSYSRAMSGDRLEFRVYDKDVAFNDRLGVCSLSIQKGSYSYSCNLEKGGVFYFSYTLS